MAATEASPEAAPWFEMLESRRVHDGFIKLDCDRVRQRRFDGGWTPPLLREIVRARAAVAVICYDPGLDRVVLVEQARLPAQIAGFGALQTEIVAGLVEPGEAPEAVACREVAEETGLGVIGQPVPIAHMITTPGHSTETVHLYCARIDARGAGGTHGVAAEHEDIRVLSLTLDEFAARLADGRIANSFSLVAGFWLIAQRDRLRAAWRSPP
jgi:ADP-ribose pyrophosphatase